MDEIQMSPADPQRRRRRAGALVAVFAGTGAAATGLARHLDHPTVQPLWHRVADIAGAVLIVAAVALLVFIGIRASRQP